jgi:hypothetical protein
VLIRECEARSGLRALDLSLGNPDSIPADRVRELRAHHQRGERYELHAYAENNNLDQFCEVMLKAFTGLDYTLFQYLQAVPIPGIKTTTSLLPLACGCTSAIGRAFTSCRTCPAYDVIGTWTSSYLASNRVAWPLSVDEGMALSIPAWRSRCAARASTSVSISTARLRAAACRAPSSTIA